MAGRLEGKVALVSGAARGQGRSHAIRLAEEGADIIAFDLCEQILTVPMPLATSEDLQETAFLVEKLDRRIIARHADVRDRAAVSRVVADGVAELGRLDIVCANAGIVSFWDNAWAMTDEAWDDVIDVNLTGVWKTVAAAVPAIIDSGDGGSIVLTGSTGGLKGVTQIAHYVAAKHGLVGLMRTLANELAEHHVRVNVVHPTGVDTPMTQNEFMAQFTVDSGYEDNFTNMLPVPMIEAVDISNAVVWLSSNEARYVTGIELPVDAGWSQKTI